MHGFRQDLPVLQDLVEINNIKPDNFSTARALANPG